MAMKNIISHMLFKTLNPYLDLKGQDYEEESWDAYEQKNYLNFVNLQLKWLP